MNFKFVDLDTKKRYKQSKNEQAKGGSAMIDFIAFLIFIVVFLILIAKA